MTIFLCKTFVHYYIIVFYYVTCDVTTEEVKFLNELTLDKLLKLKNSLRDVPAEFNNVTTPDQTFIESFGAQAMAIKAPIKRTDYEEGLYKKEGVSKISNIFSISVTTLAFLAFGGYLLCLIVQAVKSKHSYKATTVPQSTIVLNAGIKKPQSQFASYGRKRRNVRNTNQELVPEELFMALLQLCEGYAHWSKEEND